MERAAAFPRPPGPTGRPLAEPPVPPAARSGPGNAQRAITWTSRCCPPHCPARMVVRVAGGPDNDRTYRYCQTVRVRRARQDGAREEPESTPLKSATSSNLADRGWTAARALNRPGLMETSKPRKDAVHACTGGSTPTNCVSVRRGWAVEARLDPTGRAGAIRRIAEQLDVHPEVLRTWVKRAKTDEGLPVSRRKLRISLDRSPRPVR